MEMSIGVSLLSTAQSLLTGQTILCYMNFPTLSIGSISNLGLSGIFFILNCNNGYPQHTPQSAVFDLDLQWLHISPKLDTMLVWVIEHEI